MGDKVQKVAVITGASQGIGEALVAAYRELGYAVVANSRSIKPSDDVGVFIVHKRCPKYELPEDEPLNPRRRRRADRSG